MSSSQDDLFAVFDDGYPEDYYDLNECLGEGTYGTVWTGTEYKTKRKCAIKIVVLDDDLEENVQEISIMKESNSPYIVKFLASYFTNQEQIWMVMENCEAGSLHDLMYICDCTLREDQIQAVMAATTLGLEYLHKHFVIHRDVKAGNILLTADGHVRIADFGVSTRLRGPRDRSRTAIGAPFWMAPEVINESKYDMRADIWSLGITVIELAESRPPLSRMNAIKALMVIPKQNPPTLSKPRKYSKSMNDFLEYCLNKKMNKRPTSSLLKDHPFIRETITELENNDGVSKVTLKMVTKALPHILSHRQDDSDDESDFDESLFDQVEQEIEQSKPKPVRDEGKSRPKIGLGKRAQKDMKEDDISNLMTSSESNSEINAIVMSPEFISMIKSIYDKFPDAFGDDSPDEWTQADVTKGIALAFTSMVGEMDIEEELSKLDEGYDSPDLDDFDDDL